MRRQKSKNVYHRIPHIPNPEQPFSYWIQKNSYYHSQVLDFYRYHVPKGSTVLHIGCKNGYILDAVKPLYGVGIDTNQHYIEQAKELFPDYVFFQGDVHGYKEHVTFDYILVPFVSMEVDDIQALFESLHKFCHAGTRIIIETYSTRWAPILRWTQKMGLRRRSTFKNWISHSDMYNFLYLTGFDLLKNGSHVLMPVRIPGLSWLCNSLLRHVPFIKNLCLHQWFIARPVMAKQHPDLYSVSVVIPCKNERGNIQEAVTRCPDMGKRTELIFIEGNSSDGTDAEIMRVQQTYPEKNIVFLKQDGKGKGDAVRKAFEHAQGDVLMILDGDLTVAPEELPKFLQVLVSCKGEFINGSRLVYSMEKGAMMRSALWANRYISKLFSLLLNIRVKDTLCGTKVLWKKDYEKIAQGRSYFGVHDPFGDFDLLFGAAKLHLKIVDLPIHYKRRRYGKTNISRFKDVWLLWWMGIRAWCKLKYR